MSLRYEVCPPQKGFWKLEAKSWVLKIPIYNMSTNLYFSGL